MRTKVKTLREVTRTLYTWRNLLIRVNPTLSMAAVARHVEVSEAAVSKWFAEEGLVRWKS